MKVLVIGYGNPGRGDDGIGPELVRRLERMRLADVTVEVDYQLVVEHAAQVAEHDLVVFVDATVEQASPFSFGPVAAAPPRAGLTHFVSPGEVVSLAQACFGAAPPCYLLGVRAHEMDDFREGLTPEAESGLQQALAHLVEFIGERAGGQGVACGHQPARTGANLPVENVPDGEVENSDATR
jgi:hydrogenase maturation protease